MQICHVAGNDRVSLHLTCAWSRFDSVLQLLFFPVGQDPIRAVPFYSVEQKMASGLEISDCKLRILHKTAMGRSATADIGITEPLFYGHSFSKF